LWRRLPLEQPPDGRGNPRSHNIELN
jgi:hypothetical protein